MRINLIICVGRFRLKETSSTSNSHSLKKIETNVSIKKRFFNNTFTLRPSFFRIHITHFIDELVVHSRLGSLLKRRIEHEFQRKVENLTIKFTNIHHNFNLNYCATEIKTILLPKILTELNVDLVYVTEEAHTPAVPVSIVDIISAKDYPFISISIKVKGAALKIQFTKNKLKCECSLIATAFSEEVQNFLQFLEKLETKEKDE